MPYGAPPNIHDSAACSSSNIEQEKPRVSFLDRKSNAEGLTLSFIAEHSLPLNLVPNLIKYAQEIARDEKVLHTLSMERQTATYKLKHGLAFLYRKRLVNKLRTSTFSMNMDEATSNNNQKVFSILVSYFCEEKHIVVVEYYDSVSLITVSAKIIHDKICSLLETDGIPYTNVISILTDSANYMRGAKGGLQTLLRNSHIPHLLDCGGDTCHHIHNISKRFCQHFSGSVEGLMDDLYTEFKFHQDLRVHLREICLILGIPYATPRERASHRWLSVLDVLISNITMYDAFTLLYKSWLPKDEKKTYEDICSSITVKHNVSPAGMKRLTEIQQLCQKRSLTKDGAARKKRLVDRLFYSRDNILALIHLYMATLPVFKSLILSLEQKTPMIHRIYDEVLDFVRKFLSSFMKPDKIASMNASQLQKLDIDNKSLLLPLNDVYIGEETAQIVSKWDYACHARHQELEMFLQGLPITNPLGTGDATKAQEFRSKVLEAYRDTTPYLLKKLPLDNRALRLLSAVDPKSIGCNASSSALRKLQEYFPTIDINSDSYDLECRNIQVDQDLPTMDDKQRLDVWWAQIFRMGKYPELTKLMKSAISIFTAPHIECSFSVMNNVITHKTARYDISTFAAYQRVQYNLKAQNTTSLKLYHRPDIQFSPIDKSLAYHLQTAHGRHKSQQDAAKKTKSNVATQLGTTAIPTKRPSTNVHTLAKKIKCQVSKKRKAPTKPSSEPPSKASRL